MRRIGFYLRYAVRNLLRGGRWSGFALFSIAAGVATVVALRSLGLAIGDSLISNVRSSNHGDITLAVGGGGPFAFRFGEEDEGDFFSQNELERIEEWVADHDGQMTAYSIASGLQVTAVDFESVGRPQFINAFLIDPETFPPTGDILALDPAGVPLRDLFTGGKDVIISQNLASAQGMAVGDTVRVSRTDDPFTVRGIVATENEAKFDDPLSAFFGFVYFDRAVATTLDINPAHNRISLVLPQDTPSETIDSAENELGRLTRRWVRVTTVNELLARNQVIGDAIGDFIVVMGLGALLIGGVGIMNTMLVMVRRRTNEIAALKTFGLKGRQVAALFMSEALVLGLAGSLAGSLIGVLMSGAVNSYGETFLQQQLVWRIYPEALAYGVSLGLVIAVIFGVAPVLTAVKVRPGIILRPNETHIPTLGILQSLLALVVVIVVVGLIVAQIIGPWLDQGPRGLARLTNDLSPAAIGIIGVAGTLIVLAVLIGMLWVLVWIISKFPTFGLVDLRLALRNMTTHRIRTATTLLALSAGMFALSSITYFGQGTRELLNLALSDLFGGNVLVFPLPLLPTGLVQDAVESRVDTLEGVIYETSTLFYDADITAIDGAGNSLSADIAVRDTTNPNLRSGTVIAGRDLTLDDRGKAVAVLIMDGTFNDEPLGIGSMISMNVERTPVQLEVIGLIEESFAAGGPADLYVAPGVLDETEPDFQIFALQVEEEHLNRALVELSSIPLTFTLDVAFIDGLLGRLINQFSAIPTIVGLLSLFAAAVIMANTVALSTLERRRQIGVLKAIGLKGKRVLVIMLLENTVVGLVSALLGIGLSAIGLNILTGLLSTPVPLPRDVVLMTVLLVVVAILIGWTATGLSASVAIRERVMNVLRYD